MKVLDLNQDGIAVSQPQFPDAEIEAVAFADIDKWYDSTKYERYDAIVVGHVLQLVERRVMPDFMKMLKGLVRDMGEIHIYVPDLDWAARMLIENKPNPLIQYALYGNEKFPHRSGFTLLWLRQLVEGADIIVRHSTMSGYGVKVGEETQMIPQLVILGVRYDALFDPATAID
jgi:hypothetical protein